jgi:hypothetical protein
MLVIRGTGEREAAVELSLAARSRDGQRGVRTGVGRTRRSAVGQHGDDTAGAPTPAQPARSRAPAPAETRQATNATQAASA